jgi:predicted metalloendopeptidase
MSYSLNDFYTSVNKKWLDSHEIPGDDTSFSIFDELEKSVRGEIIDIIDWNGWLSEDPARKSTVPYGKEWVGVAGDFLRGKFHPSLERFIEFLTGTDYNGRMKARLAIAAGAAFPLPVPQTIQAYRTTDPATATLVSALAIAGGSVKPDYSDPAVKALEIKNDYDMRKLLYAATATESTASAQATSVRRNIRKGVADPQAKVAADVMHKKAATLKEVAVLKEIPAEKLNLEKALKLLEDEMLSRGESVATNKKGRKPSSFQRRAQALREILLERDAEKAQ